MDLREKSVSAEPLCMESKSALVIILGILIAKVTEFNTSWDNPTMK